MKCEYFKTLESILFASDPNHKISLFNDFYDRFLSHQIIFEEDYCHKLPLVPSYSQFCNIVHPTRIRRPKTIHSVSALAKVLHSIVHIEYSAIDLALDASYRFVNMPQEYYADWLEVAKEEIEHFTLLEKTLHHLGYCYGDFPVHQNLFDAMLATSHSLNHRMGLVHRALEATGLDANPFVVQKIEQSSKHKDELVVALDIILRDEISHVGKGDKWWRLSSQKKESFLDLLCQYKNFSPLGRVVNTSARIQAGYSKEELEELQNYFNR